MRFPKDTSIATNKDDKLVQIIEQTNVLAPLEIIGKGGEDNKVSIAAILPSDKRYMSLKTFITPVIINDSLYVIDCRKGVKGEKPTVFEDLPLTQSLYGMLIANWNSPTWSKQLMDNPTLSKIYSYWVSSIIATQYGLDTDERACVGALAMAFFLSSSPNNNPFDDRVRNICQRKCNLAYNTVFVQQSLGNIEGEFNTYEDFVRIVKKLLGEDKLEKLTAISLMRHIAVNAPGLLNSDVIFATAFEYPPAFCALVATIANSSFLQKSTPLGRVIDSVNSKRETADITAFLRRLTGAVGRLA